MINQDKGYFLPLKANEINDFSKYLKNLKPVLIKDGSLIKTEEIRSLLIRSLLHDLHQHNYKLEIINDKERVGIEVTYNEINSREEKRKEQLIARNLQLNKSSNREFIKRMETQRLYNNNWHSIFSVMRDGEELANKIIDYNSLNVNIDEKKIQKFIDPYLQFCETKVCDDFTGIELNDIWRYFRHTWSLEYKSVPGREIRILIRDRSADNHPIIGIAALGSSVIETQVRDKWIGWHPESIFDELNKIQYKDKSKWLYGIVNRVLESIYKDDLFDEGIITNENLQNPKQEIIHKLKELAEHWHQIHIQGGNSIKYNSKRYHDPSYWKSLALEPLYKWKRYLELARIIEVQYNLNKIQNDSGIRLKNSRAFNELIKRNDFKNCVKKIVTMIKKEKVGINIMNIMVCGSVAPYNKILGGKLISMLMASPEVNQYAASKYNNAPSIIASSLKGDVVIRKSDIVLLDTTSLYGVSPNQYTRSKVDADVISNTIKNRKSVKFKKLVDYKQRATKGYGNYHIGKQTRELCRLLQDRIDPDNNLKPLSTNNIFGEGANPLMRRINWAFKTLGFPGSSILKHNRSRIVYALNLVSNLKHYLLGFANKPDYIINQGYPKLRTNRIARYWMKRWLVKKISDHKVINKLKANSLIHPIKHEARVSLPDIEDEELGPLFSQSTES